MPQNYTEKESEKSGTESTEAFQEPDSKTNKPLEFRAEIVPYDTCENSNSPILAFSGDNVHIIFGIPKEKFRKLAVAAIGHLGHDSDRKSPENSETSGNESGSRNYTKSGEMSLPSNFDAGDPEPRHPNDVNENSNRCYSAKNKGGDVSKADPKSYEDSDPLSKSKVNVCVGSREINSEPMSIDCESSETEARIKESPSDLRSNFAISREVTNSTLSSSADQSNSRIGGSSNGSDCVQHENISEKVEDKTECDKYSGKTEKINIRESNVSELEQHDSNPEQNSDGAESDGDRENLNLSAYSIDISNEDCPELASAWPDMYPYIKADEIAVEELESFESNGVSTKYFKLDFLKEMVVTKITSSSDIVIDALKYKSSTESESFPVNTNAYKEGLEKTQSTEPLVCEVSLDASLVTDVGNTQYLTVSEIEERERDMQKLVTEMNPVLEQRNATQADASENVDLQTESKKPESKIPLTSNKSNFIDESSEAEEFKESAACDSEDVLSTNSSNIKDKSADEETEYEVLDEEFGNEEIRKMVTMKIEQKLSELIANVPGSSPTERIRFSLNDSLKNNSEFEAKNQMEELVADPAGNLSKEVKLQSLDDSNGSEEFKVQEDLNRNSQDEYSTEVSFKGDARDEAIKLPGKISNDSENLSNADAVNEINAQSDSENKSVSGLSSENLKDDENAVETPVPNFNGEVSSSNKGVSSEETSTEKSESGLSTKGNFSREMKLDNDLHVSKVEILSACEQLENANESKSDLNEKSASVEEDESETKEWISVAISTSTTCSDDPLIASFKDASRGAGIEFPEGAVGEVGLDASVAGSSLERGFENVLNIGENKHEDPANTPILSISKISQSDFSEENPDKKNEQNEKFESEPIQELKEADGGEIKTERIPEKSAKDEKTSNFDETDIVATDETPLKCPENESCVDVTSDSLVNDSVLDDNDNGKSHENSLSNGSHLMETTIEADAESISEGGDFESDDVNSIASESDDSKDSERNVSVRKEKFKNNRSDADEVDCAPTRVRTKKIPLLSKDDVIPENAEVKNVKTSKARSSNIVTSKNSGKTSPVGRSLRSKSLDPSPEQGKIFRDKKHASVVESEVNCRARATTPEVVSKKDLKTVARSSPRKLTRPSATTEPSSSSKGQSTKTSAADGNSKSLSNLDSSILTSRRSKRGSKN